MVEKRGYGVVYTPKVLSLFTAKLLFDEISASNKSLDVLDPACGESFLLDAMEQVATERKRNNGIHFCGIDIDQLAIIENDEKHDKQKFTFHATDTILPSKEKKAKDYWKKVLGTVSAIIENPPWSSEKIYSRQDLNMAGYTLEDGQYDSYVLFIELSIKLLAENGVAAFILPDSLFSSENKNVRKYLAEKTHICCIARLGEKLFPGINRATTVIVVKKAKPSSKSLTKCFRLNTEQRKEVLDKKKDIYQIYLDSRYEVRQIRFSNNTKYLFDIDTRPEEENLLRKIEKKAIEWEKVFHFGRGVEISKKGDVVICPHCANAQGFSKKQSEAKTKKCTECGKNIDFNMATQEKIVSSTSGKSFKRIYVGENIGRYSLQCNGKKFIKLNVKGVNYKSPRLYEPPKILVRKTGLGIKASIDYESTYISQTVYSCNYLDSKTKTPLEYYLALLNSRLVYYYYLKTYGENEWKSHPYITKDILFSLPLKEPAEDGALCEAIADKAKELLKNYTSEVDYALEKLIYQLYDISGEEEVTIAQELSSLPDLGAINDMKFPRRDNV